MGEAACALAVLTMLVRIRVAMGTQDALFMKASMEYNALSSTFERPWRRVMPRQDPATAPPQPTQTEIERQASPVIAPTLGDPLARLVSSHHSIADETPSIFASKDALLVSGISLCERLLLAGFDSGPLPHQWAEQSTRSLERKAAAEAAAEAVRASEHQRPRSRRPSAEDTSGVETGAAGRGTSRNASPPMRRASPSMQDVVKPPVSNEQWDACSKELREELFDTYPELDFYIGMTLDEDGMLSDGAPELQESTVASMELAVQLAALARVENPTEQPNAALARHCPALLTLAAQAMATPESLHVVLLLLAVRSLNRVSLLVHDSGARVDELSMITVAGLIDSIMHAANFAIPSIDALASVPELATTVAILLACPFRFDRFASGESNAKQLETYFQLKASHGSVVTGTTRAAQLLLVSCLGDFAPELLRAVAAIPTSHNSSDGGSPPSESESERTAIAFLQLVHSAVDALQMAGGTSDPSPSPLQASSTRNARSIGGGMDGSSHGPGGSMSGGSLGGSVGEGDLTKLVSKQAQAAIKQFLRAAEGNIHEEMEELPNSFSNSFSGRVSSNSRSFRKGGSGSFTPVVPSTMPSTALSTVHSSLKAVKEDASMREEEVEQEEDGALSTAFVRLYCMLRWRPGAARHLQLAIEGLSDGDWSILQRELTTDAQGSTSVLPARRSQLVLLDACRMLQVTDEYSSSAVTEELSVIIGTEALPFATADGHDEMRATALRVGLECLAQLLLVGRSSVSEEATSGDWPYEIFCGNALRVVNTLRAAALREKRFPRPKPDEGCAAEAPLPSQLELLKAARFCVLYAAPHYAHLGLEPPTDRSSDSALVHWI